MAGGILAFALVGLALLAIPLIGVRGDAETARAELTEALSALRSGDLAAARTRVEDAREAVDSAHGSVNGIGGDVWSVLPVAGTAVDDVRHLVDALDDATAVAEIGVDVYPSVAGKRATLYREEQVDLETLDRVIRGVREAGDHLVSADESLASIEGTTPVIGTTIAAKRDEAAERVTPAAEAFADLEPTLDELPGVVGAEGERRYLIALLNPSELRYSGGAALSFSVMEWDDGRLELGESLYGAVDPRLSDRYTWRKVRGNRFHRNDSRVANSTFAPSWSVSGEELLRAWKKARRERLDGVIAVDVVAMAKVLGAAGPVTVDGYGQLTGENFTETLVGSYDDYYPDPTTQDALNQQLIPAFTQRLFGGGNFVAKGQALAAAADGRHFATYFREEGVQDGFTALGLEGDLADPVGDYAGVFTQNTSGSKVDYYQRRDVSLDVVLSPDGSASNQLDVTLRNETPPYAVPGEDPRVGYFTRWSGMQAAMFLPDGVTVEGASYDDEVWEPPVRDFFDHDVVTRAVTLEPNGEGRFQLDYTVPEAASVAESGDLTYRLALDPQGTVAPGSAAVNVQLPDGYQVTDVPEGWTVDGSTLTYRTDAFTASQEWEIALEAIS